MARLGRVYEEAFRRIALAETEIYHSGVEMPLLRSGLGERRTMELASSLSPPLTGMLDAALMAAYRRQQELTWTEHQIEHIEQAVEDAGVSLPAAPPTAMCFLDLSGYTRLTDEHGGAGRGDRARAADREPRVVDEPLGLAEPRLDAPGQHEVGVRLAEDEEIERVGHARTITEAGVVARARGRRSAGWTTRPVVVCRPRIDDAA